MGKDSVCAGVKEKRAKENGLPELAFGSQALIMGPFDGTLTLCHWSTNL